MKKKFFKLKNIVIHMNLLIFFSMLIFIFIVPAKVFAFEYNKNEHLPRKINEYLDSHIKNRNNVKILYVMKWNGYKVYALRWVTHGLVWRSTERYILFDGKQIRFAKPEERQQLYLDVRIHYNKIISKNNRLLTKKLSRNAKKTMDIDDNTTPPQIPPVLKQYANKYMIKDNDVEFLYIMDWEGQHVYRTYWQKYGFIFNPLTVILYDGHTIRRPSKEEFDAMYNPMCNAYEKYLIELRRLHNKD